MTKRALARIALAVAALAAMVVAGQASYSASALPVHTVAAGESLWSIATTDGLTVQQLAAANGMSPGDILPVGRNLVIPPRGAPAPATQPATLTAARPAPQRPVNPAVFCSSGFTLNAWGQLPGQLLADPSRLALRPLMVEWANAYGLSPSLVEAVAWQESGWQEGVRSGAGAIGIGQVMPATARFINRDLLGTQLNPYSANDNIRLMAAFLAYLVHRVGNSPCLVAAAYYEGPVNLEAYGVLPETEQYVRDVIALQPQFS